MKLCGIRNNGTNLIPTSKQGLDFLVCNIFSPIFSFREYTNVNDRIYQASRFQSNIQIILSQVLLFIYLFIFVLFLLFEEGPSSKCLVAGAWGSKSQPPPQLHRLLQDPFYMRWIKTTAPPPLVKFLVDHLLINLMSPEARDILCGNGAHRS